MGYWLSRPRPDTSAPRSKTIPLLLAAAALAVCAPGCATRNVNPPQAHANTGYVDLHADSTNELCWEVAHYDETKPRFQRVFSELKPPPGGVLRLAFAPGLHKLRVTFLNLVVVQPAEVAVQVQDGRITPVRITLTEAGDALVRTKETSTGGTVYGRYGRRTKIGTDETATFQVSAEPEAPTPYQVKERTSYVH